MQFYSNNIQNECVTYCPLECDSVLFKFETTSILDQNTTRFRIFYRSLKYTSITEKEKYTLPDFIANVGGVLGLFIGASFVSLFEIIEIIMYLLFTLNQ